jgi:hypothetical protein
VAGLAEVSHFPALRGEFLAAALIERAKALPRRRRSGDAVERAGEHAVAAIVAAGIATFLHGGPSVPRAAVLVIAVKIEVSAAAAFPTLIAAMLPPVMGVNRIVAAVAGVSPAGGKIAGIAITRCVVVAEVVMPATRPHEQMIREHVQANHDTRSVVIIR